MAVIKNPDGNTTSLVPSPASGNSHPNVDAQSETVDQFKGTSPVENDHTLKVRKPYTITKQREKWTEEEHQKFLEALKLYGRAWRQIEEHVGTKTAVQIRSHAQKFFSKVIREGNGSNEGSTEPIVIPPPRPKRKPVHPYPRKSVDIRNKIASVLPPQEQGPYRSLLATEKQTQSPTSVLSAVRSTTPGSPVSELPNTGLSPTSCTTGMHLVNVYPVKIEKDTMNNSPEVEEKGFLLQAEVSAGSAVGTSSMKLVMDLKDTESFKGVAADSQSTTIKLFGQTVLVTGGQLPSAAENIIKPVSSSGTENLYLQTSVYPSSLYQLDTKVSLGMSYCNWKPWPVFDSSFKNDANSIEVMANAPMAWSALYHGQPVSCAYNQSSEEERMREKEDQKDKSCTGSNNGYVGLVENGDKSFGVVDSQCQQSYPEDGVSPNKHAKGFVPYKRCLAERDAFVPYKRCLVERNTSSPMTVAEEREGQGVRVCS